MSRKKKNYNKLNQTFSIQLTKFQLDAIKEMAGDVGDGDGGSAAVVRMAINALADTNAKFAAILTKHREAAIAAEEGEAPPVKQVVETALKDKEEVPVPIVEFS